MIPTVMSVHSDRLERILTRAAAGNPKVLRALREAAEVEKARVNLDRALEDAIRKETTLEGAIEKALEHPSNQTGPMSYGSSVHRGVADMLGAEEVEKEAQRQRSESGLGGVNWKDDVRPDGSEPLKKQAPKRKPKVMW